MKSVSVERSPVQLSIVIPSHRSELRHLQSVLTAVTTQLAAQSEWECILVDNGNSPAVSAQIPLNTHPRIRVVEEPRIGSARARATGFRATQGAIVATLDDDTVPAAGYFGCGQQFLDKHPEVGAVGGKILPSFEVEPPPFLRQHLHLLGLRDHGDRPLVGGAMGLVSDYPSFAPLGVAFFRGEIVRAHALAFDQALTPGTPGRVGRDSVGGCEDCELVLCTLRAGWRIGYEPGMALHHLIPATRLRPAYLARLAYGSGRDWGRFQRRHGLHPREISAWSLPARAAKQFFICSAWTPSGRISWSRYRGYHRGLACKQYGP